MKVTLVKIEGIDRPQINDSYTACSIVEGFSGEEHNEEEHIASWAYLIRTGACWSLQGWYGRSASRIIETGVIDGKGNVNWDKFDELES